MLIVRLATLYDVPAIMLIVRKSLPAMQAASNVQWDENYPDANVFLKDIEQRQLWVADIDVSETSPEIANIIGGCAAITTDQAREYVQAGMDIDEKAIVVHRLVVDPELRGLGIASALMEEAEALAFEAGIGILRVDTSAKNLATQRLFPKLGYTLTGEMMFDSRPGQLFLCYEKRLPVE